MTTAIVIPSYRRGDASEGRMLWADLRVALMSVEAYATGVDEVVVGWDGPWEPDGMPPDPRLRLLARPDGLGGAEGLKWTIDQAHADEIIYMPDDVVLHPDTIPLLLEDVATLRKLRPDIEIGLVGCRSNFVVGAANVRSPNGGELAPNCMQFSSEAQILATDVVFPVVGWFTKRAHDDAPIADGLWWYADQLWSYDLRRAGYELFISRAYAHHVGMRSTGGHGGKSPEQMNEEGLAWLLQNRPDFYAHLMGDLVPAR